LSGINTGILTNAFPLTAEQVKALENRVLETEEAVVFLDENKEVCYAMPFDPELIKELAWQNAYELIAEDGLLTKKIYKKQSLETFSLEEILQKRSYEDSWGLIGSSAGLLDESLLDEFILE
jgi:hypothetical protein